MKYLQCLMHYGLLLENILNISTIFFKSKYYAWSCAWNKAILHIDNVIESDFQIFKTCEHQWKIQSPHKVIVCFKYIRGQLKYELPYNFGIAFAFVQIETRTTMFTYFGILASVKREKVDLK